MVSLSEANDNLRTRVWVRAACRSNQLCNIALRDAEDDAVGDAENYDALASSSNIVSSFKMNSTPSR